MIPAVSLLSLPLFPPGYLFFVFAFRNAATGFLSVFAAPTPAFVVRTPLFSLLFLVYSLCIVGIRPVLLNLSVSLLSLFLSSLSLLPCSLLAIYSSFRDPPKLETRAVSWSLDTCLCCEAPPVSLLVPLFASSVVVALFSLSLSHSHSRQFSRLSDTRGRPLPPPASLAAPPHQRLSFTQIALLNLGTIVLNLRSVLHQPYAAFRALLPSIALLSICVCVCVLLRQPVSTYEDHC